MTKVFPSLLPIDNKQVVDDYVTACFRIMSKLQLNEFLQYGKNTSELYERNYIIVFSYHLGQKYSTLLKNDTVNGELCKKIKLTSKITRTTFEHLKYSNYDEVVSFFPDFVIHINDSNRNLIPENQKLILEAKTTPNLTSKGFYWDFFKLNLYLTKLKYRNAIYLILNSSKTKIDRLLTSYFSKCYYYDKGNLDRLFFFIQENVDTPPIMYKLQKK